MRRVIELVDGAFDDRDVALRVEVGEETPRHVGGVLEQTPIVVADVDDKAGRALAGQIVERSAHPSGRSIRQLNDPNVADAGREHPVLDGRYVNTPAFNLKRHRHSVSAKRELECGAYRAAHERHDGVARPRSC